MHMYDNLSEVATRDTPKIFESTMEETLQMKNDVHDVTKFSTFMK